MQNIKKDFPIFENNPELIYLDSTATTQKPSLVIDAMSEYLSNYYANIHRGSYSLSEKSEDIYIKSKQKVAAYLGVNNWREIIYSYNATYASNLLVSSLGSNQVLKKGDTILLSIAEHHANVVPWQILAKNIGLNIEFISLDDNFQLDLGDLEAKLENPSVKCISITHVSNVTGSITDVEKVGSIIKNKRSDIFYILDASQSVPHFALDVENIGCDALFFTAHKIMADTGLGVLWMKSEYLQDLTPSMGGGGAISEVTQSGYLPTNVLPDKWEFGTPHLVGAASMLAAYEYIESIGGFSSVEDIETDLISYALEKFEQYESITLIGTRDSKNRVGVFSFVIEGIHSHDASDYFAEHNICVRAGQHCAEPLLDSNNLVHTVRMSLYIYNTKQDIDRFFEILDNLILELR